MLVAQHPLEETLKKIKLKFNSFLVDVLKIYLMWNLATCNSIYEKYLRKRELKRFRKSLNDVKPAISLLNNTLPGPKKSIGSKKKRLEFDRNTRIDIENKALLNRMLVIDLKPSHLNKTLNLSQNHSVGSLNIETRIRTLNKIGLENKVKFT